MTNIAAGARLGKVINGSVASWLSVLSLLSEAFELTAFEHQQEERRPSAAHWSITIFSPPFVPGAFPAYPASARASINHFSFAQDSSIIRMSSIFFPRFHFPFIQLPLSPSHKSESTILVTRAVWNDRGELHSYDIYAFVIFIIRTGVPNCLTEMCCGTFSIKWD